MITYVFVVFNDVMQRRLLLVKSDKCHLARKMHGPVCALANRAFGGSWSVLHLERIEHQGFFGFAGELPAAAGVLPSPGGVNRYEVAA